MKTITDEKRIEEIFARGTLTDAFPSKEELMKKLMSGDRIPEPDGQHLWVMTGMWQVDPIATLAGTAHLDTESMLMLAGPGCFHCEQDYSAELVAQRCVPVPNIEADRCG